MISIDIIHPPVLHCSIFHLEAEFLSAAVRDKADLSQLDVTAAFHEKAPSISVFPLNSPHSFVTKNVYHTADRERRTSTVDSLIAPYTTDEVPVDQIDAAIWHLAGLAGGACEALDHMDVNGTAKKK